jgi:hypothetical protein
MVSPQNSLVCAENGLHQSVKFAREISGKIVLLQPKNNYDGHETGTTTA